MSEPKQTVNLLRVGDLSQLTATSFTIRPSTEQLRGIRSELGLVALRKVSFTGSIQVDGKSDWTLRARLGATVGQPCVVTLSTVTTRIDTSVNRLFLAVMPTIETQADLGEEIEMPDDETIEPLRKEIDIEALMIEAIALALPLYPRLKGANIDTAVFTEPGKTAMSDADTMPFAGLAALRGAFGNDFDDDSDTDT